MEDKVCLSENEHCFTSKFMAVYKGSDIALYPGIIGMAPGSSTIIPVDCFID